MGSNSTKACSAGQKPKMSTLKKLSAVAEESIGAVCQVLTLGQRWADWFTFQQFRVTWTISSALILSNSDVLEYIGMEERQKSDKSLMNGSEFVRMVGLALKSRLRL